MSDAKTTEPKIELFTRLDSRISGANNGEAQLIKSFRSTPHSLLKALRAERKEYENSRRGYGTIGHGRTWLEINGEELTREDYFILDDSGYTLASAKEILADHGIKL